MVDDEDTWVYFYTASEGKRIEAFANKEESSGSMVLEDNTITMQDDQQFNVEDTIQIKSQLGWKWSSIFIVRIERRNYEGQYLIMIFYTELHAIQERGIASISYGRGWRKSIDNLIGLSHEELETENNKEYWGSREFAKKVLNYRVHEMQHSYPAGKGWEQVVEALTGGAHRSENLVLGDSVHNSQLNAYYQTARRYN